MNFDIDRYMQIFRRDMETFFELMKAEDKVLLEKICKGTENRARTVLEDTEEKKTLTLSDPDNSCGKVAYDTQTLHANNEARMTRSKLEETTESEVTEPEVTESEVTETKLS